jgi:hypothetical protein
MICGSGKPKNTGNEGKLMEKLRDLRSLRLEMNLNDYKLSFDEVNGDWKSIYYIYFIIANLNEKPVLDEGSTKKLADVMKLREKNKFLDEEVKQLETEYLAKMSKLMIMAHVV